MHQETENEQSNQKELVKQEVRYHDDTPFHGDERRLFYRIHSLSNYPLDRGTAPTAGRQDLLREVRRGVGEGRLSRGRHRSGGGGGSGASVACPDEAAPRIVADLGMGIQEFLGEIVQSVVI
jgi:hypothetical protein